MTNLTEISEKKIVPPVQEEFPFKFLTGVDCGYFKKSQINQMFDLNKDNGLIMIAMNSKIYILELNPKGSVKPVNLICQVDSPDGKEFDHIHWLYPTKKNNKKRIVFYCGCTKKHIIVFNEKQTIRKIPLKIN